MCKIIQCVQNANVNVSVEDTIRAIKKAGYDGVFIQWYNKQWDFSQLEQFRLCEQLGLSIEFCHLGYSKINSIWEDGTLGDDLVYGYIKDIEELSSLGVKLVIMHLSSKSVAPKPSEIGLRRLNKILKFAKSKNVKVAFENNKIEGYLEYLFDNLHHSNMGVCYDSGHCHCHFNDKFNWNKFKNKVFAVHLHNNDTSNDQHLLPFDKNGTIDWKTVLKDLKTAGYDGPISLESFYSSEYSQTKLEDFYLKGFADAVKLKNLFKEV